MEELAGNISKATDFRAGSWAGLGFPCPGGDSNRVYALIEAKEGSGLYRSDDGGDDWTRINDDQRLTQRAWYFTHIFADPRSTDTVYMLNTGMFRSSDGGKSLELLPAPHGDHHALWIDTTNPLDKAWIHNRFPIPAP